jgi:serine/threonine protein kinase
LGHGQFGRVFLVKDASKKEFALKEIEGNKFNEREWETATKLRGFFFFFLKNVE